MTVKAVGFRIIVKPDEIKKETASGIVLALDERAEKGARITGTIVHIGEIAWAAYKPVSMYAGLQVGDKVFFAKYAGKLIIDPTDKAEYVVLNDEDIVAKYE
jgi:co-chaperonin GroES (HSP10)